MTHPTHRSCALRPLALALYLPLLGACNSPFTDSAAGDPGSTPLATDPGRASFEEIPLPEDGTVGADPVTLARGLFGAREPMEGLYSEAFELLTDSPDGQVLLFTQTELPDDSVRGIRHRLELTSEEGAWRLIWSGRQIRCRPGRGHEDWRVQHCR